MDEIVYGSLIGMAEQVRAGEISPVELVEAHLARIERLNPKLNAFANVDAERARARAKAAEAAAAAPGGKNALGSLHGVPVTVKSSIDVAGLACECGSVLRKGNTPETDAPLVARLRGAGAIVLGNTNETPPCIARRRVAVLVHCGARTKLVPDDRRSQAGGGADRDDD